MCNICPDIIHFVCYIRSDIIHHIFVCNMGSDIIQLLTFVEVDMKCYSTVNFILTDAKRRSI